MKVSKISRGSQTAIIMAVSTLIICVLYICVLTRPVNADTAKRGTCSAATVAKKAPKNPLPSPTPKHDDRVTIITLSVGVEPGQKAVPALKDATVATKRSATVEGHMVMRLVAFTNTDPDGE